MLGGVGEEQGIKTPLSTLENPSVGDRVGMRGGGKKSTIRHFRNSDDRSGSLEFTLRLQLPRRLAHAHSWRTLVIHYRREIYIGDDQYPAILNDEVDSNQLYTVYSAHPFPPCSAFFHPPDTHQPTPHSLTFALSLSRTCSSLILSLLPT